MKYALALEGGGSRGAYQAGALKALDELNVEIIAAAGTSIGSINAAYYLQEGSELLCDFWENLDADSLIPDNFDEYKKYLSDRKEDINYKNLLKEITTILRNRGVDLTNFKKTLHSYIDEEKIRSLDKDFGLVTYSLTDFKPLQIMINDIPKGKLQEYLLASSYLPVFKREKIDGKSFIDGGIYDNLPINLLQKNGYESIIAILISKNSFKQKVKDESKVIYIKPSKELGGTIDFRKEVSIESVKMGYYDTLKKFNNYYGKYYYFSDMLTDEMALNYILSIKKEKIVSLSKILSIEFIPEKRMLFEKIIPKICDILEIPDFYDYNMILLNIIEKTAELLNIDRYRLITIKELVEEIKSHINEFDRKGKFKDYISDFLKTKGVYTDSIKDKILIELFKEMMDTL